MSSKLQPIPSKPSTSKQPSTGNTTTTSAMSSSTTPSSRLLHPNAAIAGASLHSQSAASNPKLSSLADLSGKVYKSRDELSGSNSNISSSSNEPKYQGLFKPKYLFKQTSEIYAVRLSLDNTYLAVGLGDARIQIYHLPTGKHERTLDPYTSTSSSSNVLSSLLATRLPCTNIVFRPVLNEKQTKNVLTAAFADGRVLQYHVTSGNLVSTVPSPEKDFQLNNIAYSADGSRFATGGSDSYVRVYDEVSKKLICSLYAGNRETTSGHSNRIFGLRFHPKNPNILVTAGWDDTIQVWDINKEMSVSSIYGPHVCGDSLDFDDSGKFLLSGSYTKTDPLQLFSFEVMTTPPSISSLYTIPWKSKDDQTVDSCLIYTAQFFHDVETCSVNDKGVVANRYLLAGGGGTSNEVRMFDVTNKRCVGIISNLSGSVYCSAMTNIGILTNGSTTKAKFAVIAGADKVVRVVELLLANNLNEQEFLF